VRIGGRTLPICLLVVAASAAARAADPLPSWNDGKAKRAILAFVAAATDPAGPQRIAPEDRIAAFDQDGTLWVEHPFYAQAMFAIDQVRSLAAQHPAWKAERPFATVLGGDAAALATLSETDWHKRGGKPVLMREPSVFFIDDHAGNPVGIHLFIGKRPAAAFGNADGDAEMLQWTQAGPGLRLRLLVHHDDAAREFAYGPAGGMPDTKVGTFSTGLLDQATHDGWLVVSIKRDWRRVFPFEEAATGSARPARRP